MIRLVAGPKGATVSAGPLRRYLIDVVRSPPRDASSFAILERLRNHRFKLWKV